MERPSVAAGCPSACAPVVDRVSDRSVESEEIIVSCYEDEVPAFVEADMSRIYGNVHSSLFRIRLYGDGSSMSTYVVRRGGRPVTLFLFRRDGGNVRVINQVIKVDEDDLCRFATYIFARFASVTAISFDYIRTGLHALPFPYQRINVLEDIVLDLPGTVEKYSASLGKNTRRNIKRYTKKLLDAFPALRFEVCVKNEVDEQTIREIIALNRARMVVKNKVSAIDEINSERIVRLAMECGLVVVARIDGKVCAGCISFQAESNYFFSTIAHDPAYDDYWLGILCCYRLIGECIARNGREFHFLWGEYEYKYILLGVKHDLDKVAIYRSYACMLLNGDRALRIAFEGIVRQAMLWLHKAKRRDSAMSRLAIASLKLARRLKRFGAAALSGQEGKFFGRSQEN